MDVNEVWSALASMINVYFENICQTLNAWGPYKTNVEQVQRFDFEKRFNKYFKGVEILLYGESLTFDLFSKVLSFERILNLALMGGANIAK